MQQLGPCLLNLAACWLRQPRIAATLAAVVAALKRRYTVKLGSFCTHRIDATGADNGSKQVQPPVRQCRAAPAHTQKSAGAGHAVQRRAPPPAHLIPEAQLRSLVLPLGALCVFHQHANHADHGVEMQLLSCRQAGRQAGERDTKKVTSRGRAGRMARCGRHEHVRKCVAAHRSGMAGTHRCRHTCMIQCCVDNHRSHWLQGCALILLQLLQRRVLLRPGCCCCSGLCRRCGNWQRHCAGSCQSPRLAALSCRAAAAATAAAAAAATISAAALLLLQLVLHLGKLLLLLQIMLIIHYLYLQAGKRILITQE